MKSKKNIKKISSSCLYIIFLTLSCSTADESTRDATFILNKEPEIQRSSTDEDKLSSLSDTAGTGRLAEHIKDIKLILNAEIQYKSGNKREASELLFEAMSYAEGAFAKIAFEKWVKSYTENLGNKVDRLILSRLILAETNKGSASKYMRAKNLTSETTLVRELEKIVPAQLIAVESAEQEAPNIPKGLPSNDPLLINTSTNYCKKKSESELSKWREWEGTLPKQVQTYWLALVSQCSNRSGEALEKFRQIHLDLAKKQSTQALAIEATSRIAHLERKLDQKTSAANTYLKLMELYALPKVDAQSMGLDRFSFLKKRIEDTLWAARYRATVADYENAKIFSQTALQLIDDASKETLAQSSSKKKELSDLRADSYHTLAFRIAVENQKFDSAIAMNTLALQSQHLSREWAERLIWFSGFYEFLAGNYDGALKHWESLRSQSSEPATQAMTSFWIARAYNKMGRNNEATAVINFIVDNYTLNFYSVVAPKLTKIEGYKDWRKVFGSPTNLSKKLFRQRNYDLQRVRTAPDLSRLLVRAEILVEAQISEFASIALTELQDAMLAKLDLKQNQDAFIYLTRLQYNAGRFLSGISLTTKLLKNNPKLWHDYPEQILVYFPRPYREIYLQNALDTALETDLLFAISRQESGFTPEIRSGANALGIMQLIRPTAKNFVKDLDLNDETLDETLMIPQANIQIGSRFLRHLQSIFKGFPPAIYGAYNAGEYAMKTWLQRRSSNDALVFVELVPFGETKDYIKNVWRNVSVYGYVESMGSKIARPQVDAQWRQAGTRKGSGRWTL